MKTVSKVRALALASRPKTLTAALVPVVVGTGLAYADTHHITWIWSVLALLSAMCIQIGTNLVNDSIDFVKGADTEERLGPSRAAQMGWLTHRDVLRLGVGCFVIAFVLGIPLVLHGGWPLVAIGLVSLLMGYVYTGGPYPLAYNGLGDLFVLIFFGWIAVGGVYYLQTGAYSWAAFVAGTQVGLLATVLIAVNNLRDRFSDVKVGKNTLSVKLKSAAPFEITVLYLAIFILQIYWWQRGLRISAVLPLAFWPLAALISIKVVTTAPSRVFNKFLAHSALVHLGFGLFLTLGFVWS